MADISDQFVWTVVEVWRGFAEKVHVFAQKADAETLVQTLRKRCDLDEDDVQMFESRVCGPASH